MDGGSSFNHEACPMSITTQKVEARMSRSVHGYCYPSVPVCPTVPAYVLTREASDRQVGIAPLFPEILRPSLLVVLWLIRSCFYLKERFTLEPANMIQLSKYWYKCTIEVHQCQANGLVKWVCPTDHAPKGRAIHPLLKRPDFYPHFTNGICESAPQAKQYNRVSDKLCNADPLYKLPKKDVGKS